MDSRKRQALKDRLRSADPALEHPKLDDTRAADLKAHILRQAARTETTSPALWPRFAMGFALFAMLTLLLWWQPSGPAQPGNGVIQTATNEESHFQNLRETQLRELHFTTPGGTRIIWQFKNETPTTDPE